MKKFLKYDIEILGFLFFIFMQIFIVLLLIGSIDVILVYILITNFIIIVSIIDSTQRFKNEIREDNITDEDKHIYFYNQTILPLTLYFSTEAFLIINKFNFTVSEIVFLVSLSLFLTSLNYFEAYYEVFEFSKKAHYTINAVKLFIFFLTTYTLFQISEIIKISNYTSSIFVFLLSFSLLLMIMQRHKLYKFVNVIYSTLISIFIALIAFLGLLFINNALLTAFSISLIFYFFENTIQHKIEGTLTKEIMTEYILIILIMILLVKGIAAIYF
jgi:hypothetical protein